MSLNALTTEDVEEIARWLYGPTASIHTHAPDGRLIGVYLRTKQTRAGSELEDATATVGHGQTAVDALRNALTKTSRQEEQLTLRWLADAAFASVTLCCTACRLYLRHDFRLTEPILRRTLTARAAAAETRFLARCRADAFRNCEHIRLEVLADRKALYAIAA